MKKLNPKSKIGIKILDEKQKKLALPDWYSLKSQIENVRMEAKKVYKAKQKDKSIDNRYLKNNLMYDNLFSIVGERGTGKTSVLFTLYDELSKEKVNKNLLLPLIVPEMMNEGDTLIGLILSSLEHVVNDIQSQIKSRAVYVDDKFGFFKNCVFNTNNQLREKYDQLITEYISIKQAIINENYTYVEQIKIEQRRIHNSYSFMEKMNSFWDYLVDVERNLKVYNDSDSIHGEKVAEPLIYLFIDDADLVPRILSELLYIMPKYMSHPNIIVITALSPSIMRVSLEHSVYKDITGMPLDMFNYPKDRINQNGMIYEPELDEYIGVTRYTYNEFEQSKMLFAYKNVSKLSNDILLKVFAPSRRFYVKEYTGLKQKAGFLFFSEDDRNKDIPVKILFERNIYDISNLSDKGSEKLKKTMPLMVFSMLGNAAREICNVCYALEDMRQKLKGIEPECSDEYRTVALYEILYSFMSVVIDSNPTFKCLIKRKNRLLKRQYNEWSLFVDYEELNNIFSQPDYIEFNKNKNINTFISMYAMLWFIEYIVYLMIPKRNKIHGAVEFCRFLFDIVGCEAIINKDSELYNILTHIESFYENDVIMSFDINNITHQDLFLKSAVIEYRNEQNIDKIIQYINIQINSGKEWGNMFSRILYKRFSGVWLFDHFDEDEFDIGRDHIQDEAVSWARNSIIEFISDIISKNKDYITIAQEYMFQCKRNVEIWNDCYVKIIKEIGIINNAKLRLYTISDINNALNKFLSVNMENNRVIDEWICSNTVSADVIGLYKELQTTINSFNSIQNYKIKYFIIHDEYYQDVIRLFEYAKGLSLRLYIKASKLYDQCKDTQKNKNKIYVSMHLLNDFMDGMLFHANSLRVYSKNNIEADNIMNKIYSLEKMGSSAVEIYDVKSVNKVINYLMSTKALVYIFERYIKARLRKIRDNDDMRGKKWTKMKLDDVYRKMANNDTETNKIFEETISDEQAGAVDKFIKSRWAYEK